MGLAKAELALDDLGLRLGDLGLVAEVALAPVSYTHLDVYKSKAPHHVALALAGLPAHHRAGRRGDDRGAVGGVVVVDVDRGLGQRLSLIHIFSASNSKRVSLAGRRYFLGEAMVVG